MKSITNEIKARIFAQYYYCQVLGKYIDSDELAPIEIMNPCLVDYMELTPIEKITEEHAIELYRILGWKDEDSRYSPKIRFEYYGAIEFDGKEKWDFNTSIKLYQYLQSKGYASPYMDYSVNDLVELGVYKLKN